MTADEVLKKVRKLINLATCAGATEGERDNAMRMAHAFLAKHNLDMSALDAKAPTEERVSNIATFYGRPWAQLVCASIAKLMFCKYMFVTAKRATDTQHYFIGKTSNAISASLLAEFAVSSIRREGNKLRRSVNEDNAFLRSFCLGAAHAIHTRVEQMVKASAKTTAASFADSPAATEAGKPGTSVTLATVYENEEQANAAWITAKRNGKPVKTHKNQGKGFDRMDAGRAGYAYGEKVPLNRQVGGSSPTAPVLAIEHKK